MDRTETTNTMKECFRFLLEDHGCQLVKEEDDDHGVFLTYTSIAAGLRVSYEPRGGGVFVMIFPLMDGEIPEYREWYDFLDLLSVKGASLEEPGAENLENPEGRLSEMLKAYACAVRDYLIDYLKGDFAITPKLEETVRRRKEGIR